MRRVVVTGLGVVSCLGNDKEAVKASLKEGRSGLKHQPEYEELGFRSHVAGLANIDKSAHIDRKTLRFMGDAAAFAYISMQQAIADARLSEDAISNPRTGIIAGSGGASARNQTDGVDTVRSRGIRKLGPYMVPRTMGSTVSACLATPFKIQGLNYSISSACATSAHCIGSAMEQIQLGKQDLIFAGGGEEEFWGMSMSFDAMGALAAKYNAEPSKASRPYDDARDGFVIASGGGMLVIEELEHALERGAPIYAELTGYGATSDGYDMVAPSGEGAVRCMNQALAEAQTPVDYINTHGTSTPAGDIVEVNAMQESFPRGMPRFSATKSLSGHSLGAAGVHEAIYSLLMLEDDFIAASANVDNLDAQVGDAPVVLEREDNAGLRSVMSNSFGFGGTNASLIFSRYDD